MVMKKDYQRSNSDHRKERSSPRTSSGSSRTSYGRKPEHNNSSYSKSESRGRTSGYRSEYSSDETSDKKRSGRTYSENRSSYSDNKKTFRGDTKRRSSSEHGSSRDFGYSRDTRRGSYTADHDHKRSHDRYERKTDERGSVRHEYKKHDRDYKDRFDKRSRFDEPDTDIPDLPANTGEPMPGSAEKNENGSGSQNCVYGIHAVEELLKTRLTAIDHIYFAKERKSTELFELMKLCRKERLAYNLIPEMRIDQICHSSKHQGVAALCCVKEYISPETLKEQVLDKSDALILLPASVEDPGNLGAMIRSAVAFNVDAMILERKNTSPLNASVAKSAAGMVEHMSIARPKNIESLIEEFKEHNFAIIGADAAKGVSPDKLDLTGPVVLVLGGEHRGIPPYLDKACTAFVSIPIVSEAQSLNVSAATAVLLYECSRQRAGGSDE
ncbi:MAG: 23S rRNA (guanosine(2251)-2'-O)-methyltransferase RlmB [Fibrobacter sp.]|nr:23S rRNA (guanosine(2251)-2'-O)-methyltransferase RlmB [Fibrobacter sp.]